MRIVHLDGLAQVYLETAEVELLEEGIYQMHLLVVGGLKESAQHRLQPLPGAEALGFSWPEMVWIAARAQADERRLG